MIEHSRIIWNNIETVRRARKSDPATSHAAAAKAALFEGHHKKRIMIAIHLAQSSDWALPPIYVGATASEISESTGLTVVQIDRRLHEMQKAGLIEVVQYQGSDLIRNGYRCWRLV